DRTNEAHQPLGLAQFSFADCLDHDDKRVVHPVLDLLRPKLAAKVVADTAGEDAVEFLEAGRIARADAIDQLAYVYSLPLSGRLLYLLLEEPVELSGIGVRGTQHSVERFLASGPGTLDVEKCRQFVGRTHGYQQTRSRAIRHSLAFFTR